MTNPIPGADSERALFEAACDKLGIPDNSGSARQLWDEARSAAKVGANVAADANDVCQLPPADWYCTRKAGHDGPCAAIRHGPDRELDAGDREAIARGMARLAAGAPAETPKPSLDDFDFEETGDKQCDTGTFLLTAAQEFWNACRQSGQYGAVQWLTGANGELLIFTRGEYRQQLMENIYKFADQPVRHFAAQLSPAPIAGDVEKDAATVDFSYLVDGAPYVTSVDKANGGMAVIIYYSSRGYGNAAFNRIADAYRAAMLANSSSGEAG